MKKQSTEKKQQEPHSHQYNVDFTSILRIRPLLKSKEKEDHVVLEKSQQQHKNAAVAVMHPLPHLTSPGARPLTSGSPNFIQDRREQDFHFHKILDTSASQESVFYAMGLSMASTAMEPLKKSSVQVKSAVVVAMGNAESGKTHTVFGKFSKSGGHDQEGIVPRVLESLFSQSKHHVSTKSSFGVRLTLLQVEKKDVVRDLLVEQKQSTPNRHGVMALVANLEKSDDKEGGDTGGVTIEQDPITSDFVVEGASSQICRSATEARELLQVGFQRSQTSRLASFGKQTSRGHVVITLQPVLINRTREIERFGGTICVVDLASKEKGKKASRSGQMKDSISSDSTLAALMHCFRTIKHNKNVAEGRTSELDILCDDDLSVDDSEISCVSEPKLGVNLPSLKAVPWRQSKVTMLLQPLFSASAPWLGDKNRRHSGSNPDDGTTNVTLLMNAYPGHRDYAEKQSTLNDLEVLQGYEISKKIMRRVQTGLNAGHRQPPTIDDKGSADIDIAMSYSTSDDEDFNSCMDDETPTKRKKRDSLPMETVESPRPSAPMDMDMEAVSGEFAPMPPPTAPSHNPDREIIDSKPSAPDFANDFPGVTLPSSSRDIERSTDTTPGINQKQPPSRDYIRTKLANPNPSKGPSTVKSPPLQARVASSPNIQPPAGEKIKERSGWMNRSPVKTLASAVTVGRKQGLRALDKIDKLTRAPEVSSNHDNSRNLEAKRALEKKDKLSKAPEVRSNHSDSRNLEAKRALEKKDKLSRAPEVRSNHNNSRNVSARLSSEFEVKDDVTQNALLQRLKILEEQNDRLVDRNVKLEDKCEHLGKENSRLESQLREKGRAERQQEWTQQDEAAWRHSRKIRLAEQDLIQGPLQNHLGNVEQTYQINQKFLESGKQHFSLGFPKWWKGAKELNERDRTLQPMNDSEGLPSPARPRRIELTRKLSGEKRKDKNHTAVDIEQYKRLKKY